ncbi:hypothetical protein DFH06DRAFT_1130403 [Mycena polygramma]|nr:hypothetical protein DFH06DRAFT_1130403 [Mycena polygramma]
MEHPANSYRDLDFMVDPTAEPKDIKLAFLYSDDIPDSGKIVDYLNKRVNPAYRSRGIVRPYNTEMSREYRAHVMALFKAGIVRIIVCMDTAGMGFDIPNIELVVQWKLPKNLSSWIQHAGRAARGSGLQGTAVMLVEKSAFELSTAADNPDNPASSAAPAAQGRGRGRDRGNGGHGSGRRGGKGYAESPRQKRGWHKGVNNGIQALEDSDTAIPAAHSISLHASLRLLPPLYRSPPKFLPATQFPSIYFESCIEPIFPPYFPFYCTTTPPHRPCGSNAISISEPSTSTSDWDGPNNLL